MSKAAPKLDHPMFALVKERFPGRSFKATEFRGQSTLIVQPADAHDVLAMLKTDAKANFDFLVDVVGIDYLNYPAQTIGRFAVVWIVRCLAREDTFFVKTFLDPSLPTDGIADDPALYLDSVTDLWPGAEWMEREIFDMLGIRFRNHPDLRRILTWETYPAHPLRKDYPVRGRMEREQFRVIDRTDA
jgi:NADH-quinone oxidoreductase subunit C